MLVNVIQDLSVFMFFFTIVIVMFSLVFDVLAKSNAPEFNHLSPFVANIFVTLQLSLGQFEFGVLKPSNELGEKGALSYS